MPSQPTDTEYVTDGHRLVIKLIPDAEGSYVQFSVSCPHVIVKCGGAGRGQCAVQTRAEEFSNEELWGEIPQAVELASGMALQWRFREGAAEIIPA